MTPDRSRGGKRRCGLDAGGAFLCCDIMWDSEELENSKSKPSFPGIGKAFLSKIEGKTGFM